MADWWVDELGTDPAYADQILPMALEMLEPLKGPLLDAGCGEGRLMRAFDGPSVGCDRSLSLLSRARRSGAVVAARLPDLAWARSGAFGSVAAIFVLEHVEDLAGFMESAHRVMRPDGVLAVVMNHPAYTPDGAGPLIDLSDGEVLWRWGSYFETGSGLMPAGDGHVVFHHRPLGVILEAAASVGFCLERLVEEGLSPAAVAADPGLSGQEHLPRVLAARWRKL